MKVIVSSVLGKLHFHETVLAAASAGVQEKFLTGWVPGPAITPLVNRFGNLLGEASLASRMSARNVNAPGVTISPLPGQNSPDNFS